MKNWIVLFVFTLSTIALAQAPPSAGKSEKAKPPQTGKMDKVPPPAAPGAKKSEEKVQPAPVKKISKGKPKRRHLKILAVHEVQVRRPDGSKGALKVQEVSNRMDGSFGWGRPGGLPFLPKKARLVANLKDEEILGPAFGKVQVVNEVNASKGLGLPNDQMKDWYLDLRDNKDLERRVIRNGDRFDFGTAGDWDLGNAALDWGSNCSVFYGVTATFATQSVEAYVWHTDWKGFRDGQPGTYEADLFWAESCGNILGNVRFIPDAPREAERVEDDGPNIILKEPTYDGRPKGEEPPEFDKREEGIEIGGYAWVQGSSKTSPTGSISGGGLTEAGVMAQMRVVKSIGESSYVATEIDLGGVQKFDLGEPADGLSGEGFGPGGHIGVDLNKEGLFEDYDVLSGGVDAHFASNSNASSLIMVPFLAYNPEGAGITASVAHATGSVSLDRADLKSNVTLATAGFCLESDVGRFTVDSDGRTAISARYSDQEYELDSLWRTTLKGPGIGFETLQPIKRWSDAEEGVKNQGGWYFYGNITYDFLDYKGEAFDNGHWRTIQEDDNQQNFNIRVQLYKKFKGWNPFASE